MQFLSDPIITKWIEFLWCTLRCATQIQTRKNSPIALVTGHALRRWSSAAGPLGVISVSESLFPQGHSPSWSGPHSINHQLGVKRPGHVAPTWENSRGPFRGSMRVAVAVSELHSSLTSPSVHPWFSLLPSTGTSPKSTPKYIPLH